MMKNTFFTLGLCALSLSHSYAVDSESPHFRACSDYQRSFFTPGGMTYKDSFQDSAGACYFLYEFDSMNCSRWCDGMDHYPKIQKYDLNTKFLAKDKFPGDSIIKEYRVYSYPRQFFQMANGNIILFSSHYMHVYDESLNLLKRVFSIPYEKLGLFDSWKSRMVPAIDRKSYVFLEYLSWSHFDQNGNLIKQLNSDDWFGTKVMKMLYPKGVSGNCEFRNPNRTLTRIVKMVSTPSNRIIADIIPFNAFFYGDCSQKTTNTWTKGAHQFVYDLKTNEAFLPQDVTAYEN